MNASHVYFVFWSSQKIDVDGIQRIGWNDKRNQFWYEVFGRFFMSRNCYLFPKVSEIDEMLKAEGFDDISWDWS